MPELYTNKQEAHPFAQDLLARLEVPEQVQEEIEVRSLD